MPQARRRPAPNPPVATAPLDLSAHGPGSPLAVNVRALIREDLPRVLSIEQSSFPAPYNCPDILRHMRLTRTRAGLAAEPLGCGQWTPPLGYALVEDDPAAGVVTVCRLAVHERYRRRGIGRALLGRVVRRAQGARGRVEVCRLVVSEVEVGACRWLVRCGWRAVGVRRLWGDAEGWPARDGIQFEYVLPAAGKGVCP